MQTIAEKNEFAAGISITETCPFTYGIDVGARLFARATAPKMFAWTGGEVDLSDRVERTIIKGGTCPNLGPIPSGRRHRGLEDLLIDSRAEFTDVISDTSRMEAVESGAHRYRCLDVRSMHSYDVSLCTRHLSSECVPPLI